MKPYGLHRDQPPEKVISYPASVGVKKVFPWCQTSSSFQLYFCCLFRMVTKWGYYREWAKTSNLRWIGEKILQKIFDS